MIDAGVLVSVDRGEQAALSFRAAAHRSGHELHTTAPIISQVWRNRRNQARLAHFLKTVTIHGFDEIDGRRVGELLGLANSSDLADAHLVFTAFSLGHDLVTGDPVDLGMLASLLPTERPVVHGWP